MNASDDAGKSEALTGLWLFVTYTRAFSPGYNIAGLRPWEDIFDEL